VGFPIIDRYMGERLGAELFGLPKVRVTVVESPRRLRPEMSYGFVHALWWVWLNDGRSVISVPPGLADAVRAGLHSVRSAEDMSNPDVARPLTSVVDTWRRQAGLVESDRLLHGLILACNRKTFRPYTLTECQPIRSDSVRAAEGIHMPTHCLPDGSVFGVAADGKIVSVAYAHRIGDAEAQVADIGVETAEGYRRRGYAKAAVSAVVQAYLQRGGEALYGCASDNVASIATARSVGFVSYARSMVLCAQVHRNAESG
jgi:GNAT superfamily N-acetyltransferase